MDVVTNVLLWLLGVTFLVAGGMKAVLPAEALTSNPQMAWIDREGLWKARVAGIAEMLAAVVFLGGALDLVSRSLAGVAALGTAAVMVLAALTVHRGHDEPIVPNVLLGVLSLLLALGIFTA